MDTSQVAWFAYTAYGISMLALALAAYTAAKVQHEARMRRAGMIALRDRMEESEVVAGVLKSNLYERAHTLEINNATSNALDVSARLTQLECRVNGGHKWVVKDVGCGFTQPTKAGPAVPEISGDTVISWNTTYDTTYSPHMVTEQCACGAERTRDTADLTPKERAALRTLGHDVPGPGLK